MSLLKHNPSLRATDKQANMANMIYDSLGTNLTAVSTNNAPCGTGGWSKTCAPMGPYNVYVLSPGCYSSSGPTLLISNGACFPEFCPQFLDRVKTSV